MNFKVARVETKEAEQYLHENMGFQRALDFYLQENAFLKTRLAQVIDNNADPDFLPLAEHYQNNFVHNDDCIRVMQGDIMKLQRLLKDSIAGKYADIKTLANQHKKLQQEMVQFESSFSEQKKQFNRYLVTLMA
jgi:hypothetical protein